MKKTDKKFLGGVFLATAFLMGGLHAKAATTTFVFNSETPVSEMISSGQLEIWQDWMNDLLPYVEGNAVTVSFEGLTDISFSVEEPLTLGIVAPENLVENEDYFIDDYGVFYGFYSVNVALQPTCDGTIFTVNIPADYSGTEPTPEGNSTTFVFNSETPVAEMISSGQLEIWQDWMNDLLPYVEGNAVTVSFEGLTDISFSVEEPLTLSIVAPENLVENQDYFIDDYGVFYGFYSVNVALQPTCYGATFTVEINTEPTDGVDTINGANAEIYKVYNMNGIEVLSTDDRSKLDNLVPGMYIVNGKKMIIRK